jgi:hypothetical protein
MQQYQDPNASMDAPVKRQIIMVLLGFVVMTAIIATVINIIMK